MALYLHKTSKEYFIERIELSDYSLHSLLRWTRVWNRMKHRIKHLEQRIHNINRSCWPPSPVYPPLSISFLYFRPRNYRSRGNVLARLIWATACTSWRDGKWVGASIFVRRSRNCYADIHYALLLEGIHRDCGLHLIRLFLSLFRGSSENTLFRTHIDVSA